MTQYDPQDTPPTDTRSGLEIFLGDTPMRVALRLIVLSLIVGFVLSAFNLQPLELVHRLMRFAERAFITVFHSLESFIGYIALGAVIVIPIWLLIRLSNMRN